MMLDDDMNDSCFMLHDKAITFSYVNVFKYSIGFFPISARFLIRAASLFFF